MTLQRALASLYEGPWGVFDAYCLKCGHRCFSVAPVVTHEEVDLWECAKGCGMTVTHHFYPDDDEES